MDEPWGMSGPQFLAVYGISIAAATLLTAVLRWRIGKSVGSWAASLR